MSAPQPFIIERFDGGLVTELASDSLDLSQSPALVNADFSASGAIKKDAGITEIGTDSESAINTDIIIAPNRNGVEWILKICGTKLKIYDDILLRWDTIKTGLTSGQRIGYAIFNNLVYVGNPVDNAFYFDLGKITRVNGALAGGEAVITVDNNSTLDASGTVYVNGTAVTYTGKGVNTLTGCTGTPAADDNSVVFFATVDAASVPKGNMYALFEGRLIIAGVTGSGGATIYGSKSADLFNFAIAGGATAGDAFAMSMQSKVNSIKTFYDDNNNPRLMAFLSNNTIWALAVEDDATNGTLTTTELFKQNVTALNHFATVADDNDIIHIDINQQVRTLGARYANKGINKNFSDTVSDALNSYFRTLNFDYAVGVSNDNKYYLACANTDSTANDKLFIFDKKLMTWRYRVGINANDLKIYNNEIVYSETIANKIYKIDDNSKSYDNQIIYFEYNTPDIDVNKLAFERLRRVRISGIISYLTELTIDIYRDFATSKIGTFIIKGDNPDIIGNILGNDGSFGQIAFGGAAFGGEVGNERRFFVADLELSLLPDFENFRIVISNNQADSYFEISKIKPFIFTQNEFYFPNNYIIK